MSRRDVDAHGSDDPLLSLEAAQQASQAQARVAWRTVAGSSNNELEGAAGVIGERSIP